MNFQAHFDTVRSPTGLGPEQLVDALFAARRAPWRPCFDRLAAQVRDFGGEVDIIPRRTWIGFERGGRIFAIVAPAVDHLDVGLNCPGLPPAGRFRSAQGWNAAVTHRIRIVSQDDDDELIEWLRDAHEAAGPGAASGLRWSCD
jgi:hypothetical protein